MFHRDRKVAVPTHPAKLNKCKEKVAFMTRDLNLRKLEVQTLPRLDGDAAHLCEVVKKLRTEESHFNPLLVSLQVLRAEVVAVRYHVVSLLLKDDCATEKMTLFVMLLGKR